MLSEGSIVDSRGVQKIKLSPFRLFSINTFPIAYPARATFSTESSTRMVLAQPWTTCPALLRLVVTVVSRWRKKSLLRDRVVKMNFSPIAEFTPSKLPNVSGVQFRDDFLAPFTNSNTNTSMKRTVSCGLGVSYPTNPFEQVVARSNL